MPHAPTSTTPGATPHGATPLAKSGPELLRGLRAPLIAAPMFRVSGPDLVAAVCRAGVIGAFPSINARTPQAFEDWIARIEAAIAAAPTPGWNPAPYAVNLLTHRSNPRFEADFDIIQRRRCPVVITSVGAPDVVIGPVQAYGGLVLADVASLRHARRAAEAGVDGMVLLCAGAGGQTGRLNPFAFVQAVRAFYGGLLIVAGGITRGHQLHALQVAGADLGYCGSRFLATLESLAEPDHKDAAVAADIDDVWDTDAISGIPANTLRSSLARLGLTPQTRWRQSPAGDYDWSAIKQTPGVYSVGHGVSDIVSLPPAAEVVETFVRGYRASREG